MFGDVVMGVDHHHYEQAFDAIKQKYGAIEDTDVPTEGMIELCAAYKKVYRKHTGEDFPQDPFRGSWSWRSKRSSVVGIPIGRCVTARSKEHSRLLGTAVNVQSMVYGNMGDDSGTGVAFTRNPSTGENKFYGEFLVNAQGEDVVAGIRTPQPVAEMPRWNRKVHKQLIEIKQTLEQHYLDVQDIEFTIERGSLFMLQTRTGKRTGAAAVKIACDMVKEKLIDEKDRGQANSRQRPHPVAAAQLYAAGKKASDILTRGLPASPGARRWAGWRLPPPRRSTARMPASKCCWCAKKPAPKISTACTAPPAF